MSLLPPEYDEVQPRHYDPSFTADISNKMRVPDKLSCHAHEDQDQLENEKFQAKERVGNTRRSMIVPDRIMIAGDEQHIGLKKDLPLNFDDHFMPNIGNHNYVGITTPPRVITMEEQGFPSVEDPQPLVSTDTSGTPQHVHNGQIRQSPSVNQPVPYTPGVTPLDGSLLVEEESDDVTALRRQVSKLTRRVMHLEEDNSARASRELLLYPAIFLYLLLRAGQWMLNSK